MFSPFLSNQAKLQSSINETNPKEEKSENSNYKTEHHLRKPFVYGQAWWFEPRLGWPCPPPQSTGDCRHAKSRLPTTKFPFNEGVQYPPSNCFCPSPRHIRGWSNEQGGKGPQQSFWFSRPCALHRIRWVRKWTNGRPVGCYGFIPTHPRLVSATTKWSVWPWEAVWLDTASSNGTKPSVRCCIAADWMLHSCLSGAA